MKRSALLVAIAWPLVLLGCSNDKAVNTNATERTTELMDRPAPALALAGRVTDAADLLPPAAEVKLNAKLAAFEASTHHQLVVVTVKSLGGRDIADFSRDLANAWGIGRKNYNDGVVLLVAPNERKVRIAVGSGLESTLSPSVCQMIISGKIIPALRSGHFATGIEGGADALILRLS